MTFRGAWQSPRCCKTRRILLKSIFPAVALSLAMWIGWLFYPVAEDARQWASIKDVRVYWNHDTEHLHIILTLNKREDCRRVIVDKHLRRIVGDDIIATNPIPLNGNLSQMFLDAPKGISRMSDEAMVRWPMPGGVPRGQYMLTLIATCEQDGGERTAAKAVRTSPIDIIVVVQDHPITWMANALVGFA